jgi:hypothetical protein
MADPSRRAGIAPGGAGGRIAARCFLLVSRVGADGFSCVAG